MDGANMNAQVGLVPSGRSRRGRLPPEPAQDLLHPARRRRPGHGPDRRGRAPRAFLPGHPVVRPQPAGRHAIGPISAAPFGSREILPISWIYIATHGRGRADAARPRSRSSTPTTWPSGSRSTTTSSTRTRTAAAPTSSSSTAARSTRTAGIKVDDIAKRLIDFGFHAPTMSLAGGRDADDRADRERVEGGTRPLLRRDDRDPRGDPRDRGRPQRPRATTRSSTPRTPRRRCPRTPGRTRTRASRAAYPAPWLEQRKFWPAVGRVDNPYGDRNLVCTCDSVEAYG